LAPGLASPASENKCRGHVLFGVVKRRISTLTCEWLILAIVVISFILLTTAFRSVVIATKAAILNLLSIGAAYGVIVAILPSAK
jgi:hypothetical protein